MQDIGSPFLSSFSHTSQRGRFFEFMKLHLSILPVKNSTLSPFIVQALDYTHQLVNTFQGILQIAVTNVKI